MRLYGGLINRIDEMSRPHVPTVGMGATLMMHSDRHAYSIVEVSKETRLVNGVAYPRGVGAKRDKAFRADSNGMSESQSYDFKPDPAAAPEHFTLRKNGTYVREGESMRSGTVLAIGHRDEYYDFSF